MAIEPTKLIAAISPNIYCDDASLTQDEIEEIKEKLAKLIEKSGENPSIKTRRDAVRWVVKTGLESKEKDVSLNAYLKAAEVAKLKESEFLDLNDVIKTPFKLAGLKNPIEIHSATYDTSSQALEQVYYWLQMEIE